MLNFLSVFSLSPRPPVSRGGGLRLAAIALVVMCGTASCSGCSSSSSSPPATAPPSTTRPAPPFPARQRLDTSGLVVYQVWLNSYAYKPAVGQMSRDVFVNAATHLRDLATMGVNTIQLSPFHPFAHDTTVGSPYSVKNYYAVNPGYSGVPGDTDAARQAGIDALRRYVSAAHSLGMRVLMDCVYHSTAPDNALTLEHPEFYKHRPGGGIPKNQFGFAELDYSNPALRAYMIDMTKFWAVFAGVDGCRADLANTIALSFWAMLNNEMKKIKPGWLMIAELPYQLEYAGTYSGPGFRPGETYHDVYAFDASYGAEYMSALRKIVNGKAPATSLRTALSRPDNLQTGAPSGTVFYRGVDNHDQEPRAAALKGGNDAMLAAMAVNFTIGGIPFVFNGQEVGDVAPTSVFAQTFIDWTHAPHPADAQTFERLSQVMHAQPALLRGTMTWCEPSQPGRAVAYLRSGSGQRVLVVANLSSAQWTGTVSLPSKEPTMKRVVDLLSGVVHVARGHRVQLSLPPYAYLIGTVNA